MSALTVPRLQLLCAPQAFRKDLSLVLFFFHIRLNHWSYCQFIWPPAAEVRDNTQLYVAISKDNYDTPVAKLELCLSTLRTWSCYNGLALDPDKSEAIVFGTTQRSRSLSIASTVNVAGTLVQVSNQVRILDVTLDSRFSFDAHISPLSKSCVYHIRTLRHIRSNVKLDCFKNIARFFVGRRLDYANATLVGISVKNISRLQRLQSMLARVVTCLRGLISISKTL